jgi:hypothetical protein
LASGTRRQRAVEVKPWDGRKVGILIALGSAYFLTQIQFWDTRIKPGRYFVVRDRKNQKAREKSNLGPRRGLRRLYSYLE